MVLISFIINDDNGKRILRARTMTLIAMATASIKKKHENANDDDKIDDTNFQNDDFTEDDYTDDN